MRPGRWRYLRTAKVMLQFPTYARLVWGLARDARTPVGLKLLLGGALTYVVTPVDLIPDVVPILGHADDLTVLLLVLDLFISNVSGAQKQMYVAGTKLREMYAVSPLLPNQVLAIGVTSYNGMLYFGINADRDAMSDVAVLPTLLRESLDELLEAAQ